MKKILVPTDFSKPAVMAAAVAVDLAKKEGSTVLFLHVIEAATDGSFNVVGEVAADTLEDRLFTAKMISRAKKEMDKMLKDPKFSGARLKGLLRLGNPFHGMRSIITEEKVDLIVMGTTGRTKLEEIFLGSNAERVIRHARCPVLTIQKKPAVSDFKNIVYATAMSPEEEVFSRTVMRVQQLYDSTLHLVRINTPGEFQPDQLVKGYMEKFAKKLQLRKYTMNVYNDFSAGDGIISFANRVNADMIAMATHGRKGIGRMLTSSVAEEVASRSLRPVLTFVVKH